MGTDPTAYPDLAYRPSAEGYSRASQWHPVACPQWCALERSSCKIRSASDCVQLLLPLAGRWGSEEDLRALRSPGHWRGAEPGFNVDQSIRAGRSRNKKASKCYNNVFNRSSNRYRNKFGRLRQHCFIHRCNPNDHKLFYQACLSSSPVNLKSNAKAPPYGFIHTEEPSVLRMPVSRPRSEHNDQQHLERFIAEHRVRMARSPCF